MLTVHQLSKAFGIHPILANISFSVGAGERVGLIGPNGCGKTTLLRILTGEEAPDQGHVTRIPGDLRVGYLSQSLHLQPHQTIAEALNLTLGNQAQLEAELSRLGEALAKAPKNEELHTAYDMALQELQQIDLAENGRAAGILKTLGLANVPQDQPVRMLSGGQKTRLGLALALLGSPQLLLLDEPTNHLDIQMLEWLESWLIEFSGAALIVSHDRTFLDHTVSRILDLNPETHTLQEYTGNYSDYLEQFLQLRQKQQETYRDQEYEIRRMKQDINRTKQQAAWVEQTTTSRQPVVRRYAKKVAKKAKSREKKLDRYLESGERVEKPKASWQMKLELGSTLQGEEIPHLGQDVITTQDLTVGYPGFLPLLEGVNLHARSGGRVAISGPNGAGKTSLLRTIGGQIPPLSGEVRIGSSARLGFMSQEQELLDPGRTALETLQQHAPMGETETRSFLHYFLFSGDEPLRPVRDLSFGEKARLALATLVAQGCNVLLLDEPVNHLDISSRTAFEEVLSQFPGTILAVVHDRYFIQRFATEIWWVDNGTVLPEVLAG